ncbi:hypothetical protein D917_03669, partial [Trichinella nativa]
ETSVKILAEQKPKIICQNAALTNAEIRLKMAPIWPAEHFAKIVVSEQCFHEKKKKEKKQVAIKLFVYVDHMYTFLRSSIGPFLNIFVH